MGTAFGTRFLLLALLAVGSSTGLSQEIAGQQTATFSPGNLPTLTFSELVTLSKDEPLPPALETKLNRLLHAAEVDNSFPKATPIRVPIKDAGPGAAHNRLEHRAWLPLGTDEHSWT